MARLLGLFLPFGKQALFVIQFAGSFVHLIEPLCHFLGLVELLLFAGLLLLEDGNLGCDLIFLIITQQVDVAQLLAQQVALVFLFLADLIDFLPHLCILFGSGHFLKQGRLGVVVALKELGKLALGQHNGAKELVHVQSRDSLDLIVNLFFLGINGVPRRAILGLERPDGVLQRAIGLVMGAVNVPGGDVERAIVVIKSEAHVGTRGSATQQLPHVVGVQAVLGRVADAIVGIFVALGRLEARCVAIQGQAHAVDNGRFASSSLAADEEQTLPSQGGGVKVDLGMLDRRDIVDGEFLEFHCLFSSCTS